MSDDNEIEAMLVKKLKLMQKNVDCCRRCWIWCHRWRSVYDSPVIQIQTWLHISPTIRRGRDTSFRMSLRLNTKKLKMVITLAYKMYLFRLLLPVKKELFCPYNQIGYVFQPNDLTRVSN